MSLLAPREWRAPDPESAQRARAYLGFGLVAAVVGAAASGGWLLAGRNGYVAVAAACFVVAGVSGLVAAVTALHAAVSGGGRPPEDGVREPRQG